MSDAASGTPNEEGVPDGATRATKWAKPDTTQRGRERPKSPQKQERPEDEKERKGREERKANRRETAGEEMEKRDWKEREKKRTGTKCDSQRGRGARDPR